MCFSFLYFYLFQEDVILEDVILDDETGVLEVLEIKIFFATQPLVGTPLQNFLRILSVDFKIQWWHLCEFLEHKKSKKALNVSFYYYQVFSISERK